MGMAITHSIASGMGGVRTAGDLVGRMQMTRGMKIREAKEYVAGKLRVSVADLSDPVTMAEVRGDLDLGRVRSIPKFSKGIDAKFRIAELLGIEINCVVSCQEWAESSSTLKTTICGVSLDAFSSPTRRGKYSLPVATLSDLGGSRTDFARLNASACLRDRAKAGSLTTCER
jgi:dimethylamine--corrinoid protein Co-methyltransferase